MVLNALVTLFGLVKLAFGVRITEMIPPRATWDPERDMPDLTGKIAVVTGANVGIGKETARRLVAKGAKVYVASRDAAKSAAAVADLKATQPDAQLEVLQLDLADLPAVKRAAEELLSKERKLDMLFCNAGVMAPPVSQLTAQGYDLQWGTNVLGHFYFTQLLLPAILAAGSEGGSRVILTSSSGSASGEIDFETMDDTTVPGKRQSLATATLYAQSKLGNIILAKELARRYADEGLVSISLNPGNIQSELTRHIGLPTWLVNIGAKIALFPVSLGALTQLYAGTAPEAKELNGQYLIPWARLGKPNPLALDVMLGQKVWEWCERQVKDV